MQVLMTEGLFTEPRVYKIKDINDSFVKGYAIDFMLQRQIDEPKATLLYEEEIRKHLVDEIPFEMIKKGLFEHSEPGYIYLMGTLEEMRASSQDDAILMRLNCPVAKLRVDLTIKPRAYAYGLDVHGNLGETAIAWLAVEPGIASPAKVTQVEANMRTYLHSIAY